MAVPPTVDNPDAQAILVRIGRAAKRAKVAVEMLQIGAITAREYEEHRAFEATVTADAVRGETADGGVIGAPGWFAPSLAAALAPVLAAALEPVNNRLSNIETRIGNIETRMQNLEARQQNAFIVSDSVDSSIQPLVNATGEVFPNFPGNSHELHAMNGREMTGFLNHYDLQGNGAKAAKLQRIKRFVQTQIGGTLPIYLSPAIVTAVYSVNNVDEKSFKSLPEAAT
ncbi:MAG: hypothetical protein SGBAC_007893 [Bacillariaceae sp.]